MNTKGERIATNLLGRVVVPRIADPTRGTAWPATWPAIPIVALREGEDGRQAEVVGVFVVEGHVRLLVKNLLNGHLANGDALEWKVIR